MKLSITYQDGPVFLFVADERSTTIRVGDGMPTWAFTQLGATAKLTKKRAALLVLLTAWAETFGPTVGLEDVAVCPVDSDGRPTNRLFNKSLRGTANSLEDVVHISMFEGDWRFRLEEFVEPQVDRIAPLLDWLDDELGPCEAVASIRHNMRQTSDESTRSAALPIEADSRREAPAAALGRDVDAAEAASVPREAVGADERKSSPCAARRDAPESEPGRARSSEPLGPAEPSRITRHWLWEFGTALVVLASAALAQSELWGFAGTVLLAASLGLLLALLIDRLLSKWLSPAGFWFVAESLRSRIAAACIVGVWSGGLAAASIVRTEASSAKAGPAHGAPTGAQLVAEPAAAVHSNPNPSPQSRRETDAGSPLGRPATVASVSQTERLRLPPSFVTAPPSEGVSWDVDEAQRPRTSTASPDSRAERRPAPALPMIAEGDRPSVAIEASGYQLVNARARWRETTVDVQATRSYDDWYDLTVPRRIVREPGFGIIVDFIDSERQRYREWRWVPVRSAFWIPEGFSYSDNRAAYAGSPPNGIGPPLAHWADGWLTLVADVWADDPVEAVTGLVFLEPGAPVEVAFSPADVRSDGPDGRGWSVSPVDAGTNWVAYLASPRIDNISLALRAEIGGPDPFVMTAPGAYSYEGDRPEEDWTPVLNMTVLTFD